MQTSFDLTNLPVFVRVRNVGTAEASELLTMWNELFSQEFWKPDTGILFDNRKLNPLYTHNSRPEDVAENFGPDLEKIGAAHVAVLAPISINQDYANRIQDYVNKNHAPVRLQYFYTETNAINWLYDAYRFGTAEGAA